MRDLIIPDIHQNIALVERILGRWEREVDRVVFLGDYFDARKRAMGGRGGAQRTVDWFLNSLQRANRIHLLGNHDLSYRWPEACRCSGRQDETMALVEERMDEALWRRCFLAVDAQGWLASHAGIHPHFLENASAGLDLLPLAMEKVQSIAPNRGESSALLGVGMARGGMQEKGGITWLDWDHEFEAMPGLNQIVGHTNHPFQLRCSSLDGCGRETRFSVEVDALDGKHLPMKRPDPPLSINWCLDSGLKAVGLIEDGYLHLRSCAELER